MTFEFFQQNYGEKFYSFINSEMGRAMLMALRDQGPLERLKLLPAEVQSKHAKLFLGQTTGWGDALHALEHNLIVMPGRDARDVTATYEAENNLEGELDQDHPTTKAPPPQVKL